jgi:signal transduction histidine kinase
MLAFAKRLHARGLIVPATLLIVIGVGVVDYATGWELSFSIFYLLAVGLATWFIGTRFAIFIAVLSMAASLSGDLITSGRFSNHLVPWWNASIALTFYFVVVGLLANVRDLYSETEARVRQRTVALTAEMAERERIQRELLEISEREQRRIGQDLHDSLGQHLTGASLAAQVLEDKLAARGFAETADAGKVVELVEEGISLTRNLAKGLHPVQLSSDGLMHALEELAVTSSDLFHLACRFECDSPVLVRDSSVSGHLFRIAQEAVSNAARHGKAPNIQIQLEARDDGMVLMVKDDGVGLPDPVPSSAGIGLRIMTHRANVIGAQFQVRRGDSGGTIVSCIVPRIAPASKGSGE